MILSGQNGYDVCRTLRGMPAPPSVKIVILAARSGAPEEKKIQALGADLLIRKPFFTRKPVETVRQLLAEPPPLDG